MLFRRDSTADLSNRLDATFALLSDASWKTRGVEEITIGSAIAAESRRSYQCADVGDVLGPLRPRGRDVTLLLPVTTLPKRPLLGFDISAPDRSVAYLPPRAALAEVEAEFVVALARQAGVRASDRVRAVLVAVCEFTPGPWLSLRRKRPLAERVAHYVAEQTDWTLTRGLVESWLDVQAPSAALLAGAAETAPDEASSAENPVLVVPFLRESLGIGPDDVRGVLEEYADFVARCSAVDFVEPFAPAPVLAEYGRRWELMVWCTVPLDGPFIVRMSERLPLAMSPFGSVELDVTIADALSNHTVVRVVDENVRIRKRRLEWFTTAGTPLTHAYFDHVRHDHEEVATYTANPARDYRIRLRLRLATAVPVVAVNAALVFLMLLSLAVLVRRWSTMSADDLAVVVIPTTFAASVALTRERTTLATRLQAPARWSLLGLTVLLWALVAILYLSDTHVGAPARTAPTGCARETVTPSVLASVPGTRDTARGSCDGQEHR